MGLTGASGQKLLKEFNMKTICSSQLIFKLNVLSWTQHSTPGSYWSQPSGVCSRSWCIQGDNIVYYFQDCVVTKSRSEHEAEMVSDKYQHYEFHTSDPAGINQWLALCVGFFNCTADRC